MYASNRVTTHLLKLTILVAPRSLTVNDPQPSKPTSTRSNQRLNRTPILGSTNHVRAHAAHDREHGYYNTFTLYRGCTCST
jgi:hypothetical protein